MDIIIIIHAFDRAATSAQAHARTLALSLSLPIYLSLVYLLACVRAKLARATSMAAARRRRAARGSHHFRCNIKGSCVASFPMEE